MFGDVWWIKVGQYDEKINGLQIADVFVVVLLLLS